MKKSHSISPAYLLCMVMLLPTMLFGKGSCRTTQTVAVETNRAPAPAATNHTPSRTDNYIDAYISADDLFQIIQAGEAELILDVRPHNEFISINLGHIRGSLNIPYDSLTNRLAELESYRDADIYIISHGGEKAEDARVLLERYGFPNCIVVEGGMLAWQGAGFETINGRDDE